MVYVYDMGGVFIESYNLPTGNYGFSFKYVNELLFASVDGSEPESTTLVLEDGLDPGPGRLVK